MTLLVRDEEDIVRANLDYHLARGVDFVIATDNRSEDGTVAILEEYEARGVLRLLHEPDDDYAQGRWVTRMARLAATDHGADWVINNDADEFWCPPGDDLRVALQSVPEGTDAVLVPRFNFVVPADGPGGPGADPRPFAERMTVRYAVPYDPIKGGPVQPKMAHRAHPEARVLQGNHDVHWPGRGAVAEDSGIEILHFPIRTEAQFANKIAKGGAAYARNTELPPEVGHQWRRLHAHQLDGTFDEEWARLVLSDEAVVAGLADGTLVEDHRLADLTW